MENHHLQNYFRTSISEHLNVHILQKLPMPSGGNNYYLAMDDCHVTTLSSPTFQIQGKFSIEYNNFQNLPKFFLHNGRYLKKDKAQDHHVQLKFHRTILEEVFLRLSLILFTKTNFLNYHINLENWFLARIYGL